MQTETVLFIILAGITALLLALFQYVYKTKKRKLNPVFAFLRFITIFGILLLIINPKFEKTTTYNEKPTLAIVIDDSESIKHLDQQGRASQFITDLKANRELSNKFDLEFYSFGDGFKSSDSFSFSSPQTDISKVFTNLKQIYKDDVAPTVLITDGNQTFGSDYTFTSQQYEQPVFPVILGDTTIYSDLRIQQLNVNKYAYLKNRFPVEIITTYNGNTSVTSQLVIRKGNTVVHREDLDFSKNNSSHTLNITLPANTVGISSYVATIMPLEIERNKINNSKPFAVEVIDQKTEVAIVSSIIHPDLGALKRAIETNQQRSVTILEPVEYLNQKDLFQMVILYQPNSLFNPVFESLDQENKNRFIITGVATDWNFLNKAQSNYLQTITEQEENFQPVLNNNFTTFNIDDIGFDNLPPLRSEFGTIQFNTTHEILLYKSINNNIVEEPLLATFESAGRREVILFGEDIWRWRSQNYLDQKTFQKFDDFIGKIVQYTASNSKRNRLTVNYESFYNGNGNIKITSQFFNKNYEFNSKANLRIILKNTQNDSTVTIPFVLKQNNYEVDLSNFVSGDYQFTVSANNGEVSSSGQIKILDYNVEQQFLNANVTKLQQLATNSEGSHYFIREANNLINDLIADTRFPTIQKSSKNIVPLIDFKYLLVLIALSLAIEWFLRKYNGLI